LMPVGTAISIVVIIIGTRSHVNMPEHEHVVRPDGETEHEDRQQRQRHQAIAEDRLRALVEMTSEMIPNPGSIMM
jgi:hypothetical protein